MGEWNAVAPNGLNQSGRYFAEPYRRAVEVAHNVAPPNKKYKDSELYKILILYPLAGLVVDVKKNC